MPIGLYEPIPFPPARRRYRAQTTSSRNDRQISCNANLERCLALDQLKVPLRDCTSNQISKNFSTSVVGTGRLTNEFVVAGLTTALSCSLPHLEALHLSTHRLAS
jgi:hypothetical protein